MLKIKNRYKDYAIETDDAMIIVLLEKAIQDKIEELEYLLEYSINNELDEYEQQQYRKDIKKFKSYLKQL